MNNYREGCLSDVSFALKKTWKKGRGARFESYQRVAFLPSCEQWVKTECRKIYCLEKMTSCHLLNLAERLEVTKNDLYSREHKVPKGTAPKSCRSLTKSCRFQSKWQLILSKAKDEVSNNLKVIFRKSLLSHEPEVRHAESRQRISQESTDTNSYC